MLPGEGREGRLSDVRTEGEAVEIPHVDPIEVG
jgi:hypothetical protein